MSRVTVSEPAAIKAVALDLDGTLLSSALAIAPETLSAIRELHRRGCVVIIATARPVRRVQTLAPSWFSDYYWAIANGAWICRHGSVIARTEIPEADARDLVTRLVQKGLQASVEANDLFYTERQPGSAPDRRPLHEYGQVDACKVLVHIESEAEANTIREHVDDSLSMVVTDGGKLVQIAKRDCGKLNAVQTILDMEAVGIQHLIAFGDDNNDIELLQAAGVGVAMANGTQGVRDAATFVTSSNDEDGVGEVLRSLLSGEPVAGATLRTS